MYTCTHVHLYTCTPVHLYSCTPVLQVKHRYSDWREPSIDRKLHFAAPVKAVIAGQLVAVFEGLDQEGIIC